MVNTDAVAVTWTATNGTLDKMILAKDVFPATELTFMGNYKTKLASARTSQSDDMRFMALQSKYILVKAMKK